MPAFAHSSTLGSWFFQAVVESGKLTRMTENERAAFHNKTRGRAQRESTLLPGTAWPQGGGGGTLAQTNLHDFDESYRVMLTGVRIIRPTEATEVSASPNGSDLGILRWWGDPALVFPRGRGVSPFVRRPVVTTAACEFLFDQTVVPGTVALGDWQSVALDDAHFRVWTDDQSWIRAYPGRPFGVDHRGRPGPSDWRTGLRLHILSGRLGASAPDDPSDVPIAEDSNFKALYVHWMAHGYVAAY